MISINPKVAGGIIRVFIIAFVVTPFTEWFISLGIPYSLANFFSVAILSSFGIATWIRSPL